MALFGRFAALDGAADLRSVVRRVLRTFASIVLVVSAFNTVARAQSLQRLTVTQLTLSADTATPHIEVPFHLIVTAHVRERITELDNLDLPILAELELLGSERTTIASRSGSTYRETITVVAHHSGAITIAPVTLDATDARNGKNFRYSSNSLTLHVQGPGTAIVAASDAWQGLRALLAAALRLALILVGVAGIILLIAVLIRRRPLPAPAVTLAPPVPVVRDPRAQLREALGALQHDRTRAGAMRARHIVRRMVGATDAETLADVLRRPLAADLQLRDLLRALERAGFTHDADLTAAIPAAVAQLERMTR
jgi:hypothetical protein